MQSAALFVFLLLTLVFGCSLLSNGAIFIETILPGVSIGVNTALDSVGDALRPGRMSTWAWQSKAVSDLTACAGASPASLMN